MPLLLLLAGVVFGGCGDKRIVAVQGTGRVQGVWEGVMSLTATADSVEQTSRIRLELVQREFNFDGLMVRIDPLAEGFGKAPADTLVVTGGTVSGAFVSFRTEEPGAGSALFEGTLTERALQGSVQGEGFTGTWQVGMVR